MPSYCVAANCTAIPENGKVSLHPFPRNRPEVMRQWVKFVQCKRANFPAPTRYSALCSDHFVETDFINYAQFKAGFSRMLVLDKSSVPSVHKSPAPKPDRPKPASASVLSKTGLATLALKLVAERLRSETEGNVKAGTLPRRRGRKILVEEVENLTAHSGSSVSSCPEELTDSETSVEVQDHACPFEKSWAQEGTSISGSVAGANSKMRPQAGHGLQRTAKQKTDTLSTCSLCKSRREAGKNRTSAGKDKSSAVIGQTTAGKRSKTTTGKISRTTAGKSGKTATWKGGRNRQKPPGPLAASDIKIEIDVAEEPPLSCGRKSSSQVLDCLRDLGIQPEEEEGRREQPPASYGSPALNTEVKQERDVDFCCSGSQASTTEQFHAPELDVDIKLENDLEFDSPGCEGVGAQQFTVNEGPLSCDVEIQLGQNMHAWPNPELGNSQHFAPQDDVSAFSTNTQKDKEQTQKDKEQTQKDKEQTQKDKEQTQKDKQRTQKDRQWTWFFFSDVKPAVCQLHNAELKEGKWAHVCPHSENVSEHLPVSGASHCHEKIVKENHASICSSNEDSVEQLSVSDASRHGTEVSQNEDLSVDDLPVYFEVEVTAENNRPVSALSENICTDLT